jgi:hypothetical protein
MIDEQFPIGIQDIAGRIGKVFFFLAMSAVFPTPAIASGTEVAEISSPSARKLCPRLLSNQTAPFSGLFPAIEQRLSLSRFRSGEIVEIDPRFMSEPEAVEYIRAIQMLGARVSIYLVGGHCDIGADCDSLPGSVRLGTTGSWNWDKEERRILDITDPAVLARLASGIENGWRLGANYIRIDNLHHPAGSSAPRTPAQMKTIIDLALDVEDQLRASGVIAPERVTGLVAHNNLIVWEQLITEGKIRRPPAFLTSERTAQLAALPGYEGDQRMKMGQLTPADVPEIGAGARIAEHFQIPFIVVEFARAHDLTRRDVVYESPIAYAEMVSRMKGVTEVIIVQDESHYVGRDRVIPGSGPRMLAQKPLLDAPLGGQPCSFAQAILPTQHERHVQRERDRHSAR